MAQQLAAIERSLIKTLKEQRLAIFPTEFVAHRWRQRMLRSGQLPILWGNSLISWGNFRDNYCIAAPAGQPINTALRIMLCTLILGANRQRSFFSTIVPPSQRAQSAIYLQRLARMVPSLPTLIHQSQRQQLPEALIQDLRLLHHEYSLLLQERGLYEPQWHRSAPQLAEGGAQIYFPEAIPNFADYATLFHSCPEIAIYHAPYIPPITWRRYSSIVQEIEDTGRAIAHHLERGVDPADIIISVPELSSYSELLLSTMRYYAIPCALYKQFKVADCAPFQLLQGIFRLSQFNFHYQLVQDLLENPAIPWKEELAVSAFLKRAIDKRRIYWALPRPIQELCTALSEAKNAAALEVGYRRFSKELLDSTNWQAPHKTALEHTESLLASLVYYERQYHIPLPKPLEILLLLLHTRTWRMPMEGQLAICNYPEAAGADARYHYVINMTHHAAQQRERQWEHFPDQLRLLLEAQERDYTTEVVGLLANSGSQVYFSFSDRTYDGVMIPLPLFYQHSPQLASPHSAAPSTGSAPPEEQVAPHLQAGARYLMDINSSWQESSASSVSVAQTLFDPEDPTRLLISFSRLQLFQHCPLALFIQEEIGIHPTERYINVDDYRYQGQLAHRVLLSALQRWHEAYAQPLHADQQSTLLQFIEEELQKSVAQSLKVMRAAQQQKLRHQLTELCNTLISYYSGWYIAATEEPCRNALPNNHYTLIGRPDLLLIDGKRHFRAIIDIKRSAKSYAPSERWRFLQLAFYSELVENDSQPIHSAAYLFTETKKRNHLLCISSPGVADNDEKYHPSLLDEQRQELRHLLQSYDDWIAQRDISPFGRLPRCSNCYYPAICRRGFSHG